MGSTCYYVNNNKKVYIRVHYTGNVYLPNNNIRFLII